MNEEFMNILKHIAGKRMELSLIQMGKNDSQYKNAKASVIESGKKYESLEMPTKNRELIDHLLQDIDVAEMEEARLIYLAGFKDCILILSKLELFDF